jgi:hypothetical protein
VVNAAVIDIHVCSHEFFTSLYDSATIIDGDLYFFTKFLTITNVYGELHKTIIHDRWRINNIRLSGETLSEQGEDHDVQIQSRTCDKKARNTCYCRKPDGFIDSRNSRCANR